jgi:hypothetical protein
MNLKLLIAVILYLILNLAKAQDFGHQYWQMRQRLLDKFIRVGDCHGCSIPASKRDVKASIRVLIFSPQFIG